MCLEQEIANWNGKSSDAIEAIYSQYANSKAFISNIIALSISEETQTGATWLLKRHLENGIKLNDKETALLFNHLPSLQHWEPRLHVLQSLPYLIIGKNEKLLVEMFLRNCLSDKNKFLRAWAYNGFYEISVQYPEYRKDTQEFFNMAMRDEAASVKARIRNIVKRGF